MLSYWLVAQFQHGDVLVETMQLVTGVSASSLRQVVDRAGTGASGQRRAVALAVVISTWSSLRLFRAIEAVFAKVYNIRKERSLARPLVNSLFVWVAVTVTFAVIGVVAFLFRGTGLLWTILGPVLLWLSLCLLFLPLYYTFSGADTGVVSVLPGTALAAGGWTVSAVGLRLYVGVSSSVDYFGLIGAVLLVLTWLCVVGLSVVLGAILNAHLADRLEAAPDWDLFDT